MTMDENFDSFFFFSGTRPSEILTWSL